MITSYRLLISAVYRLKNTNVSCSQLWKYWLRKKILRLFQSVLGIGLVKKGKGFGRADNEIN